MNLTLNNTISNMNLKQEDGSSESRLKRKNKSDKGIRFDLDKNEVFYIPYMRYYSD